LAKRVSVDKWLFGVTLFLVSGGLLMVFSASAVMAKENFHSPYHFLLRQFVWAIAGILAMFVLMNVDYKIYRRSGFVYTLLGLTTLLLISVFFLDRSHNTHRWIRIGSFFSFQPAELAKPAIIFFLAYFLELKAKAIEQTRALAYALVPLGFVCALILAEPDLGTSLAIALVAMVLLFVAGARMRYFGYAMIPVPLFFYVFIWKVKWRHDRILAFLDPFADPQGKGFHIIQSLIAVGTGGLTGMGFMEGKQKLFYLPEPHTDFIFAVIAEEWGLLGALVVVTAFSIFVYRGMRAASSSRDLFARYLAVGFTAMVAIQAFFNISVVLALLPTKGIPLPFISSGGTSLFITLACVGVLLNITQQTD
jgi:cell division protein FtsW